MCRIEVTADQTALVGSIQGIRRLENVLSVHAGALTMWANSMSMGRCCIEVKDEVNLIDSVVRPECLHSY